MLNKVQKHKEICEELTEIYKRKNHDYGDSYALLRQEYPNSILIRIFDKYQRLKTLKLSNDEAEVKDESIKDTLKDLINYCIMELIEMKMDGIITEPCEVTVGFKSDDSDNRTVRVIE